MSHAKPTPQRLRVFLSSPGDVVEERTIARRVIESVLPQRPALKSRIYFEVVAWDHPEGGVAVPAGLTPQEAVNQGLAKPSDCDVTVVILWSRMGTPLPSDYRKDDGSPYLSGTEWEYEDALKADPTRVFVYRCTREPPLPSDRTKRPEFLDQIEKVETFLDRMKNPDGSLSGGITSYPDPQPSPHFLPWYFNGLANTRQQGCRKLFLCHPLNSTVLRERR